MLGSERVVDPFVEVAADPLGGTADVDDPLIRLIVLRAQQLEFGAAFDKPLDTAVIDRVDVSGRSVRMRRGSPEGRLEMRVAHVVTS